MFAVIARVRVDPAKTAAFEEDFASLAAYVHANEPHTLVYHLGKSRSEPDVYEILEIYRSEEDVKPHAASDAFQQFRPKMIAALLGPPEVSKLDVIV
jgi:quinol monooxygenase YgiN